MKTRRLITALASVVVVGTMVLPQSRWSPVAHASGAGTIFVTSASGDAGDGTQVTVELDDYTACNDVDHGCYCFYLSDHNAGAFRQPSAYVCRANVAEVHM